MTNTPRPGRAQSRSIGAGAAGMVLVGGSVGVSRTLIAAPLFTAQAIRYARGRASSCWPWRAACGAPIRRPRGREWLWLVSISATGLVLFNVAIVRGVAHARPGDDRGRGGLRAGAAGRARAAAAAPARRRRQVVLAAVMVTAGAVLVEGAGRADAAGLAWAAVALACEAAFTLLAVPVLARHGAWGVSVHSVWIGAVMLDRARPGHRGPGARRPG